MEKNIMAPKRSGFTTLQVEGDRIVGGINYKGEWVPLDLPATMENINKLLPPLKGAYVSVWNCQASIVLDAETNEVLNEENLSEEQKQAVEEIKSYVIYTENGGAINWSGTYPFSEYSVEILRQVLRGNTDAVKEIAFATEKDFESKARSVLNEIRDYELVPVYDSALVMGCSDLCTGYHMHEYITKIEDKLYLVDDGYGHHVVFLIGNRQTPSIGVQVEEIEYEEAFKKLVEYLQTLAERESWTVRELEDYDFRGEVLYKCDKCGRFDIISEDNTHFCSKVD